MRAGWGCSGTPRGRASRCRCCGFTQKVLRKEPGNWTFVLVTDRKELDEQLYGDFADSGVITSGREVHADSSAHLRELLGEGPPVRVHADPQVSSRPRRASGMPVLSERADIVVITDEAHRSQYDTLAANMRLALPNASFPRVHRPHRSSPARRRPGGCSATTCRSTTSGTPSPTGPPSRSTTRTAIPELQLTNDDFDDEFGGTCWKRLRSTTPRRRRWRAASPSSTS